MMNSPLNALPAYTLPDWLTDEAALRDEAVLFGLSEARPDEKIAQINLAFAALTAPLEKQIEYHQYTIGALTDQLQTTVALPDGPGRENWPGTWPVVPFVAGLLLTLGLSTGVYAGTLALLDVPDLALLLAGITGVSGGAGTLLSCRATHRNNLMASALQRQRQEAERTRQQTERRIGQQQIQAQTEQRYRVEAMLNQQRAHRNQLISLFESEFDLARSLRHVVQPSYEPI